MSRPCFIQRSTFSTTISPVPLGSWSYQGPTVLEAGGSDLILPVTPMEEADSYWPGIMGHGPLHKPITYTH